jgi:sugar lactone lactonase YvrE
MTMSLTSIIILSLLAQTSSHAPGQDKAKAQALLKEGTSLYENGNYAQALDKFNAAYAVYTTRTCQTDGTWTGTAPMCNPVDCGALIAPTNGTVNAPTTTYQTTATYACSSGYAPSAGATRTCQANGTWSGSAPTCNLVDCGALPAPTNGTVSVPTTTYQSTATYSCLNGYDLSGGATRTCGLDGKWSGSAPGCTCPTSRKECGGSCVDTQTDNNNCGRCSAVCAAVSPSTAQQCSAGHCLVTLASGLSRPHRIAVDSTSVYFTCTTGGTVLKLPLAGGTPVTLASGQTSPVGLVVDANYVYWTNNSSSGTINKILLDGGTINTLASAQNSPTSIAVDGESVYWTNNGDGTVMKVSAAGGGTPVSIASGQNTLVALDIDSTNAYWPDSTATGSIMKTLLNGTGTAAPIASSQDTPHGIVVDGSNVYWTNYEGGSVLKVSTNGGAITTLASGQDTPRGITVDGSNVYWTNYNAGTVLKVPVNGGTITTLASGQNTPGHIAVDGTSAYWTNYGGSVMKLTPK